MIIGYSFRDDHINQAIVHAVRDCGLRFFVIDAAGSDVVRLANSSYGGAYSPSEIDEAFATGLVGSSRRSLSETFGEDTVSLENVRGFLA